MLSLPIFGIAPRNMSPRVSGLSCESACQGHAKDLTPVVRPESMIITNGIGVFNTLNPQVLQDLSAFSVQYSEKSRLSITVLLLQPSLNTDKVSPTDAHFRGLLPYHPRYLGGPRRNESAPIMLEVSPLAHPSVHVCGKTPVTGANRIFTPRA